MGVADALALAISLASWIGQFILLLNLPLLMTGAAHVPWHIPILLILSPTIMALLQLALSRTREFDADRGAVELTGDAEGLASALMELERRIGRFWEEIFPPGGESPSRRFCALTRRPGPAPPRVGN